MVAALEKPEIASSGLTSPVRAKVAISSRAILSTVKTSKAKSKMVISRIEKTSIISVVIFNDDWVFKDTHRNNTRPKEIHKKTLLYFESCSILS